MSMDTWAVQASSGDFTVTAETAGHAFALFTADHPDDFVQAIVCTAVQAEERDEQIMSEHFSVDSQPVTAGAKFWDNNLRVVQVTGVAEHSNPYADTGETQTWHDTTGGSSDTLTGTMRPYGRLVRRYEGKDAEDYAPGTNYSDVKS